ncbi:hypothetical protein AVE30378_05621 [Achromobacter veterisilvae]|uniref:Bacteriophage tail tape measure C-terminal domain-containing protein n=2 Tax=Achromobacter veterisilvae TaxID=2069367 RepID=A0A446CZH8_9BURK|nr:hypothetical protein AVE30378_05621 [Achromobacter veterisilvae]
MATAGSITIDLLMRTGSFETDAKRAEKRMKEMDATIKKWGVGIGAAVGASTAAFTAMVVKAAETGAELQRMAALSASSTTAFQEWAYGAKSVGIEQDKLADILKDTQDKLGEFLQTGGGPLKDFFENIAPKVGATAEEFRKLSGPQALELYFQSLEKAKLNQAEMTFYMEALASDSSKLAPLLRNNGTGLKAMADQAHSLGIILKEDAVANAAAFNKTLESMGQVAKGAFFELSSGAISALNSYTDHVLKAKTATDSWLSAMKAAAYYEVFGDKDPTKELANAIKMATEAEQTLVNFRSGMGSILSDSQREVAEAPIKDQIKAANEYLALIQRMSAHSAATPMLPAIEVAAGNGKGKPKDTKTRTDEGQKLIDQMNERIALFGKETEYEKLLAQISMGSMQFRTQAQQEEALGSAQTLDFLEKEAAAYKENQEHLEALAKVSQDTSEQMSEFAVQAARNIQTSLGDGLYDLLTGNFDNIGARFGEMVLRMASDAAAANLAGALFGDYGKTGQIGGLLGGLAASVLGSTISASCSYVSAGPAMGSWEGLSHFAAGGYTGAGGKYDPAGIVHAGEYVIPADATKRLGVGFLDRLKGYADGGYVGASGMPASAGGSTRVEIINNGTPQQVTGVRQSMDLRGEIISIFVDDMRKNGRSARAVQGVVGR